MSEPIHILSLGAGVQSSAMLLMALLGEIEPRPAASIFADTQDEPFAVYLWLSHLEKECYRLKHPLHRVTAGRLSSNLVNEWGHSQIPAFYQNDKGQKSIGRRQCTKYYKVIPVRRKCREIAGDSPVILWQGISTDEVSRCKDSGLKWLTHRFPLIEKSMSRQDCLNWMQVRKFPKPPKSACVFCPYRGPTQWRQSKTDKDEWDRILEVDAVLAERGEFLHPSLKRINEVDFSTEEERGQLNMFNNDCEGMCGT